MSNRQFTATPNQKGLALTGGGQVGGASMFCRTHSKSSSMVPTDMLPAQHFVRADLPNFPEEVVAHWLDEYVTTIGWPPRADYLTNKGNRWNAILRYKSIECWRTLTWKKETFELPLPELSAESRENILGVGTGFVSPHPTKYSSLIPDLRQRCADILAYMTEHRIFPVPVMLVRGQNDYDVADGNHRLAVYYIMMAGEPTRSQINHEQTFWIANPTNT